MNLFDAVGQGGGVMVRRVYVEVAGDFVAGALLSQIAYWNTPSIGDGKSKLRVKREGRYWLAKTREELAGEACISIAQYRRAIKVLTDKGLVETRVFRFAGITQVHFYLRQDQLALLAAPYLYKEQKKKSLN